MKNISVAAAEHPDLHEAVTMYFAQVRRPPPTAGLPVDTPIVLDIQRLTSINVLIINEMKDIFYLMMHSTHFIYGYMASQIINEYIIFIY